MMKPGFKFDLTAMMEDQDDGLPTTQSITQPITKFGGLVNCGNMHVCVQLLGSRMAPGKKNQLTISVLNKSTCKVKAFHLGLKQKSHYYASPSKDHLMDTPHPQEISKTLWSVHNPPSSDITASTMDITASTMDSSNKSDKEAVTDTIVSLPDLPTKTVNTYQSHNHYVRHILKVTLVTEGATHSNVVVKLPVIIGPPVPKGLARRLLPPERASVQPSFLGYAENAEFDNYLKKTD